MRILKNIISGVWLIFVVSWYLKYHTYYKSGLDLVSELLGLIVIWGVLWGVIVGVQALRGKSHLVITPLRTVVFAWAAIWVTSFAVYVAMEPAVLNEPVQIVIDETGQGMVFDVNIEIEEGFPIVFKQGNFIPNASENLNILPEEVRQLFTQVPAWKFSTVMLKNGLFILGAWALFIFLFHNLGALALRHKKESIDQFFKAVGMGMGVTMLALFLLGIFHQLNSTAVWITIGGLLVVSLVKSKLLFKGVWNAHVEIKFKDLVFFIPLMTFIGIVLTLNFIDAMNVVPIGYDSINLYHNTPQLLEQYGTLITGVFPYNFELIISLGLFLFDSPMQGLMIVFLTALLGFALFFETLRAKLRWETALLVTTVFVSLPMSSFLMHIDPKIDLPLFFFSLLAIRESIAWWKHPRQHEANAHLILAGIFLGIAFGIKVTSFLLIATVFAFYAYLGWGVWGFLAMGFLAIVGLGIQGSLVPFQSYSQSVQTGVLYGALIAAVVCCGVAFFRRGVSKKVIWPVLLTGLTMAITISPWVVSNGVKGGSLEIKQLLKGPSMAVQIESQKQCPKVFDFDPEYAEYLNYDTGISTLGTILWNVNINPGHPNNRIVDIGFLFAGFFVLVALSWKDIAKQDPDYKKITLFTLFYLFLWLISAIGVIWYGIPLFIGLFLIYGKVWEREKWCYVVIAVWLMMSLFLRYSFTYYDASTFLYGGGATDESVYKKMRFPGFSEMAEIVNSPEGINENILTVEFLSTYFVEKNIERLVRDRNLDIYVCLLEGQTHQETLENFKEADLGFVIFSNRVKMALADVSPEITKRFEGFEEFADAMLIKEVETERITLYRIP